MAGACKTCLGMGFVGDDGAPCPTCGTTPEDAANAFKIAEATARPARNNTLEGVDGPLPPGAENEVGQSAEEAGFSQQAIAAQQARDLEVIQRGR